MNTAENIRSAIELMDQTDIAEETVQILVRMIEEKRLKVRVYTKGRMHAKAYIFTYGDTYNLTWASQSRSTRRASPSLARRISHWPECTTTRS